MTKDMPGGGSRGRDKDAEMLMVYCPECGRENWSMWVALNKCAWCGYERKEKK